MLGCPLTSSRAPAPAPAPAPPAADTAGPAAAASWGVPELSAAALRRLQPEAQRKGNGLGVVVVKLPYGGSHPHAPPAMSLTAGRGSQRAGPQAIPRCRGSCLPAQRARPRRRPAPAVVRATALPPQKYQPRSRVHSAVWLAHRGSPAPRVRAAQRRAAGKGLGGSRGAARPQCATVGVPAGKRRSRGPHPAAALTAGAPSPSYRPPDVFECILRAQRKQARPPPPPPPSARPPATEPAPSLAPAAHPALPRRCRPTPRADRSQHRFCWRGWRAGSCCSRGVPGASRRGP
jgi:hypothetical protein